MKKTTYVLLAAVSALVVGFILSGCQGVTKKTPEGTSEEQVTQKKSLGDAKFKTSYLVSGVFKGVGSNIVIGEVENVGKINAEKIVVTANFYDKDDKLVDTISGPLWMISRLSAGEKTSFVVPTDKDFVKVEFVVKGDSTEKDFYRKFKKLSGTYTPPESSLSELGLTSGEYVGEVENTGNKKATSVIAVVSGYDASGKLVSSGWGSAEPSDIEPGGKSSFKIPMIDGDKINTVKVQFDCREYLTE